MKFGSFLLTLALALAGCSASDQRQARDDAIVAGVKAQLAAVDVDSSTAVDVVSHDGTVTLTGRTHDIAERGRYDAAARSVGGVKNVDDQLTIDPSLRGIREQTGDVALQAKVMAAIAGQAGVNALKITVTASGGVVTLDGTVPRESVRATVVDTVRGTNGVVRVVDRLKVKP